MPHAIIKIHQSTQRINSAFLTDQVRRQTPYLAAVNRGDREECVVGRGRFRRTIMSVDVLQWGEEQTPPWKLDHVGTNSEGDTEWSYLYLHQDIQEEKEKKREISHESQAHPQKGKKAKRQKGKK